MISRPQVSIYTIALNRNNRLYSRSCRLIDVDQKDVVSYLSKWGKSFLCTSCMRFGKYWNNTRPRESFLSDIMIYNLFELERRFLLCCLLIMYFVFYCEKYSCRHNIFIQFTFPYIDDLLYWFFDDFMRKISINMILKVKTFGFCAFGGFCNLSFSFCFDAEITINADF